MDTILDFLFFSLLENSCVLCLLLVFFSSALSSAEPVLLRADLSRASVLPSLLRALLSLRTERCVFFFGLSSGSSSSMSSISSISSSSNSSSNPSSSKSSSVSRRKKSIILPNLPPSAILVLLILLISDTRSHHFIQTDACLLYFTLFPCRCPLLSMKFAAERICLSGQ